MRKIIEDMSIGQVSDDDLGDQLIENELSETQLPQERSERLVTRRSTRTVHPLVWMKDFVSLNINKDV